MKQVIIGMFAVALSMHATAQTNVYHPFPDSNAVWGIATGCNIDWGCYSSQYIQNSFAGDTLIDGMNYRIVHETTSSVSGPCCDVPSDLGAGYLRDDTAAHKVYWRIPGTASDTLLYDFTLEVGDTLRGLYGSNGLCAEGVRTVQSIDSIQLGGTYRKKINFLGIGPCNQTSIIEGVGSTTGLTSCYYENESFGMILTCFTVGDELLYTKPCGAPDLVACSELPLGIPTSNSTAQPDALVTPNPSTGQFTLGHSPPVNTIAVYTSTGQQIWQGTGNTIDLTDQPPGVYTAVVATEGGRQAVRLVVMR